MLLAEVASASRALASTPKRLEKVRLLADLLRRLHAGEIEAVAAWLIGGPRQGRVGVGYSTIRESSAPPASRPSLELLTVDRVFTQLAEVRGGGSENRRLDLLRSLLAQATAEEQQFLIGVLGGELRQGALEGIMLDALAAASGVGAEKVRRAAMMAGSAVTIAQPLLERGEAGLSGFEIQLFRPVQPMLAQSAEDTDEALAELGDAALEYKLDGARIQAHKAGDDVRIFSRAMNDVTPAVPEVVAAVRAFPADTLVLDGETLSLDANGRPQPFQVSMRRFGRKVNVDALRNELPMTPFWFDLLYLNGQSVMESPQVQRFDELGKLAPHPNLVPHLRTASPGEARQFAASAIASGHEGVMAKSLASTYSSGARGQSWLKMKQARTLDLVILAAEWGNGRRQGFLSNLHLGARDIEHGGFAMLGKTFKGLTDEMLAWQTQEFLKIEIARDKYTVYLEPKIVAEIAFNEIQVSSRYKSGLALRFARVKRYRFDKTASQADTYQLVKQMAGLSVT